MKKNIYETPILSIIIPVYNVQDYLADCLNSVINQDFPLMEIICIDDCSSDNSLNILKKYAQNDGRIKVIKLNENSGLANTRNVGVDYALGKYICYLDSDDMLANECLKLLIPYLDDNLEMITYNIAKIKFDIPQKDINDDKYRLKYDYSQFGVKPGRKFFAKMMSNKEFYSNVYFALYNRSWLINKQIKFKKGIIYEDGSYTLACYLQCEKMQHVNVEVYVRRYRANSIMTSNKFTFAHMRGLLYRYEEAIRLYYQLDTLNQNERKYLLHFITNTMEIIRKHIMRLSPTETLQFQTLEGMSKLLSIEINNSINYAQLCIDGLRLRIMEAEHVYLYGSGQIGLLTISYLHFIGLSEKVLGFIETNRNSQNKQKNIPIFCIKEVIPNEKTLLILSSSPQYHTDMLKNAKQQGFKNIIPVDSLLKEIMYCQIEGKSKF